MTHDNLFGGGKAVSPSLGEINADGERDESD